MKTLLVIDIFVLVCCIINFFSIIMLNNPISIWILTFSAIVGYVRLIINNPLLEEDKKEEEECPS